MQAQMWSLLPCRPQGSSCRGLPTALQFQRCVTRDLHPTLLLILEQVIIAGVIFGHVAAKYVYVRIWRGSSRMHEKSFVSIGSWVAINLTGWIIAWVIAESIPVFNDLLSLIVRSSSDCAHFANTYI